MKLTVDFADKQWEAVKAIWLTGGVAAICISPGYEENTARTRGKVFSMTSLVKKLPCEEWAELCATDRQPARAKDARKIIEFDVANSLWLKTFIKEHGEIVQHQAMKWQGGANGVEAQLADGTVIAKVAVYDKAAHNSGRFKHFLGWQVVGHAA
jgi:hypothetical protein